MWRGVGVEGASVLRAGVVGDRVVGAKVVVACLMGTGVEEVGEEGANV